MSTFLEQMTDATDGKLKFHLTSDEELMNEAKVFFGEPPERHITNWRAITVGHEDVNSIVIVGDLQEDGKTEIIAGVNRPGF